MPSARNNYQWLFLEPYVHLARNKRSSLFYNSLSHKILEFSGQPAVDDLVCLLERPSNGYVIPVSRRSLQLPEVQSFIRNLRETFMGDLLDTSWSAIRPANVFPEPLLRNPIPRAKPAAPPGEDKFDPRNYIREVTFFLNSAPSAGLAPFQQACRQFSYPAVASAKKQEMDPGVLHRFLLDLKDSKPALLHFAGADLTRYPALPELLDLLATLPFPKKHHLLLRNHQTGIIPLLSRQARSALALYVTFPSHPTLLNQFLDSVPEAGARKKAEIHFVVSNPEELQMSLELIQICDLKSYFFHPFYTGSNDSFLKEQVFVSREEIYASHPTQRQVFSRLSVNENDFGKFWIKPSGEVFANLNDRRTGNITTDSVARLVLTELESGKSWSRIRNRVSPCRDCLYHFLCPPISSLELFCKRFNFCTVYPDAARS